MVLERGVKFLSFMYDEIKLETGKEDEMKIKLLGSSIVMLLVTACSNAQPGPALTEPASTPEIAISTTPTILPTGTATLTLQFIQNGGFDSNILHWEQPYGLLSHTTDEFYTEPGAAQVITNSSGSSDFLGTFGQCIDLRDKLENWPKTAGNLTLVIEAYLKTDENIDYASLNAIFSRERGCGSTHLGSISPPKVSGNQDWTKVSETIAVPDKSTSLHVFVWASGISNSAKVFVDDIRVYPKMDESTDSPRLLVDSGQRLGNGRSWDVSLGDLDRDGDLDAFVANSVEGGDESEVWLNNGQGVFSIKEQNPGYGMGLDLGDLDNDGDLDVFIVGWEDTGRVLLNDGTATFIDSGQRLGEKGGFDVTLGDLDSDNDLDAIIAHEKENTVWINDGKGIFHDSGQLLGSKYSAAVGIADVDGDGDLDAVTAGWNEPGKVWLNDGNGNFTDSGYALSPSSIHMHGLAVGDLNADGASDAFLTGSPSQIWFNDGTGRFIKSEQRLSSPAGDTAAIGDIDGDGDPDIYLAAGDWAVSDDKLWLNDGNGFFTEGNFPLSTEFSSGIGLGDLDGDGDLDAFVAHGELGRDTGGGIPNEVWLNELY